MRLRGANGIARGFDRRPNLLDGHSSVMLDVHRSNSHVRTVDPADTSERGEYGANAVLAGHSIDADMREHNQNYRVVRNSKDTVTLHRIAPQP